MITECVIEVAAVGNQNSISPGPLKKHGEWSYKTILLQAERQEPLPIGYCLLIESWPRSVNSPTLQSCAWRELRELLLASGRQSQKSLGAESRAAWQNAEERSCQGEEWKLAWNCPPSESETRKDAEHMSQDTKGFWHNRTMNFLEVIFIAAHL